MGGISASEILERFFLLRLSDGPSVSMEYAYKWCAYENWQKIIAETRADTTTNEVKKN